MSIVSRIKGMFKKNKKKPAQKTSSNTVTTQHCGCSCQCDDTSIVDDMMNPFNPMSPMSIVSHPWETSPSFPHAVMTDIEPSYEQSYDNDDSRKYSGSSCDYSPSYESSSSCDSSYNSCDSYDSSSDSCDSSDDD